MGLSIPDDYFTPAGQKRAQEAYDAELVARYEQGLPLTKADQTAARKLIRARSTEAR